jgi:translocation and assembly module TamB
LGSFLSLVLLLVILLQFSFTQRFLTNKAEGFLSDMFKTRVEIGSIQLTFPKAIRLKEVYIEDQHQDTLLYGRQVDVDIDYFGLLNNNISINRIGLEGFNANIKHTLPDSSFNFDFILQAFAADTTLPADTTAAPGTFYLGAVELTGGHVRYADDVTGTYANVDIGHLNTDFDKFDIERPEIFISSLELENSSGSIVQTLAVPPSASSGMPDVLLGFDKILLKNLNFTYEDKVLKDAYSIVIGESRLNGDNIDLPGQSIDLKSIALLNSSIIIAMGKRQEQAAAPATAEAKSSSSGWTFTLGEMSMTNNTFRYDDNNFPEQAEGIDFNHLLVSGIHADIKKLFYGEAGTSASIQQLAFTEKSGFLIKKLRAEASMDSTSLVLNKLDLQTGSSHITHYVRLDYPSLGAISRDLNSLVFDARLNGSRIAISDIIYFDPRLLSDPLIARNRYRVIAANGHIKGRLNDLAVNDLRLSTLNTSVHVSGRIKNLPDINKAHFTLDVKSFSANRSDLQTMLPPSMLPRDLNLPTYANGQGNFAGTLDNFDLTASLTSSMGSAAGKMEMRPGTVYKAAVSAKDFDLGELLNDKKMFGKTSFTAKINGVGFKPATMRAAVEASVREVEINQYRYTGLELNGVIEKNGFTGIANLDDKNVVMNFDGNIRFDSVAPVFKFKLDVIAANLQALNFTDSDVRFKGSLVADVSGTTLDNLNGNMGIKNVLIVKDGITFPVDSFLFLSVNQERKTQISINSDILTANFNGNIKLSELDDAIYQHFHHYYNVQSYKPKELLYPQLFDFDITIHNADLLTKVFYTDLKVLDNAVIQGSYDSRSMKLDLNATIPRLVYTNIAIDSLQLVVRSDSSRLTYSTAMSSIAMDTFTVTNAQVFGHVISDSIYTHLAINDTKGQVKYTVGSVTRSMGDEYRFQILPSPLVLNYENWKADPDNYLQYKNGDFRVYNLKLTNDTSSITFNTMRGGGHNPAIKIDFDEFKMATITNILKGENFMNGTMNGELVVDKVDSNVYFTSDLKIDSFSYLGDPIGNIDLQASNKIVDKIDIIAKVSGNENDYTVKGFYNSASKTQSLNLYLHMETLNLSTMEHFTGGYVSRLKGLAKGDLHLTGTPGKPQMVGNINFKNTGFNYNYLNTYLNIYDETVNFTREGIVFDFFTVFDTTANEAIIDGKIFTTDYTAFRFDLEMKTENFLILNTPPTDQDIYYGTIVLGSSILVKGDLNRPVVEVNAKLKQGTELTLVIPQYLPNLVERQGVVEFVDAEGRLDPILFSGVMRDTMFSGLKGIDLVANVEVDKTSLLKLLIDPAAGDYIEARGATTMSVVLDPSGKLSLSGRYEIEQGHYQLTFYNFVRKRFDILKGSSITWAGELLDADADITAQYVVRTSPYDLVAAEIADLSAPDKTRFRQRLPFQVLLIMKGRLMKPEISFQLSMPPEQRDAFEGAIYTKLQILNQQDNDLNKQVFSLLVLNRFTTETGFANTAASSANTLVRESASKILSQQLNNLTGTYINFVELNLNVQSYEDFSSGVAQGRTELQIDLRKQFLNNKIVIEYGGNLDLEGKTVNNPANPNAPQTLNAFANNPANLTQIPGDIAVEYRVTYDGTYRIRLYRRNSYDGIIDAQIIRTVLH